MAEIVLKPRLDRSALKGLCLLWNSTSTSSSTINSQVNNDPVASRLLVAFPSSIASLQKRLRANGRVHTPSRLPSSIADVPSSPQSSYKPSPLSYGPPRASPFRRPESPHSPSPLRQSTPNPSPTKTIAPSSTTPSRLANHSTPTTEADARTPRGYTPAMGEREPSPTRGANASPGFGGMLAASRAGSTDNNSLSKLQPAQVRELREGFQILDRDSDGHVGREDVADMLTQLGELGLPMAG